MGIWGINLLLMKQILDFGGIMKLFSCRGTPGFLKRKMFTSTVVKFYYKGTSKTLCPQTTNATELRRHDYILGICETVKATRI